MGAGFFFAGAQYPAESEGHFVMLGLELVFSVRRHAVVCFTEHVDVLFQAEKEKPRPRTFVISLLVNPSDVDWR